MRRSTTATLVAVALLIIADAKALTIVITPALFLLLSLATSPVDDVACIAAVVDGAASVHASLSVSLAPVPTT